MFFFLRNGNKHIATIARRFSSVHITAQHVFGQSVNCSCCHHHHFSSFKGTPFSVQLTTVTSTSHFLSTSSGFTSNKVEEWNSAKVNVLKLPSVYASLSKWYLTLFVGITMNAGFCLATVPFHQATFLLTSLGTLLCSASANTLNQVIEVPYDAQMSRTRRRALVRGLVSPFHAVGFAAATAASGIALLYFGGNPLTAVLGGSTILLYAALYTPLKRRHWCNTWVGAVVGAIPPLMGWTAATGSLDLGAFILSGILFAWQFPHFYALAWRRRGDYALGSYHMLPLSHPEATKHVVVGYSLILWLLCSAAPATGVTTMAFTVLSIPMNTWLTHNSINFSRKGDSRSAQRLYKCSLYYILLISAALLVDRKLLSKQHQEGLRLPIQATLPI